ncbi:MAG: hypothetical protein ACI9R8_002532, partial [Candidatus Paceibacteria bacterium]
TAGISRIKHSWVRFAPISIKGSGLVLSIDVL